MHRVLSPDGRVEARIGTRGSRLEWSVTYRRATVIEASQLGLELADGLVLGAGTRVGAPSQRLVRDRWKPLYGRNAQVHSDYRELVLPCTQGRYRFAVVVRAYNQGVAIRHTLTRAPAGRVVVAAEHTGFRLPDGALVYGSRGEEAYTVAAPGAIPDSGSSTTDSGRLFDSPVTVITSAGTACLAESARLNYPRLMFAADGPALTTRLMQHAAGDSSGAPAAPREKTFELAVPASTPWRVVTLGADGPDLINHSDLVAALAEPSRLADTSWIRPGKVFTVWQQGQTTATGIDGIDFAVERGLSYISFDAGWYGPESDASSDPTKVIDGLDLKKVISYGAAKGIGVILYINQVALDHYDVDKTFATVKQWGAAGVKLGFLTEGTQRLDNGVVGYVEAAAKHRLLVDTHDNLRPWGQERTYPNWLNLEGVRGNENYPTASHNVVLPFCRNVAGPLDYTPCIRPAKGRTTPAHQVATTVVYYQPLEFLFWGGSPDDYRGKDYPELAFLKAVPSVWDESVAVAGEIGHYIVMARRSGQDWYLGAMNNQQKRVLEVPLTFLGRGSWTATMYADGEPGAVMDYAIETPLVASTRRVGPGTTLTMTLQESGGQAIRFTRS